MIFITNTKIDKLCIFSNHGNWEGYFMHISLTPELEGIIKEKVASGLYNNASEVVREALRFMRTNEELIDQMKLNNLRAKLAGGEGELEAGRYTELEQENIGSFFQTIKNQAQDKARKSVNVKD
jgi:antitoxin ParD1/3/4